MVEYVQVSLFPMDSVDSGTVEKKDDNKKKDSGASVSERVMEGFDYMVLPFFGCDFESVYPMLVQLMPKETILFDLWGQDVLIMAEVICAGICHQINWDFLRSTIFSKLTDNPEWVMPNNLSHMKESDVFSMLQLYDKPERIRAKERVSLLQEISRWGKSFPSVSSIFFNDNGDIHSKEIIRQNLLKCSAFSVDPEEKKMKLLLQKLSSFDSLRGLGSYCQPAIDYHLIRNFLRRGLLFPKNEFARDYIKKQTTERKEGTVAAVRHVCSDLMLEICTYTGLDVNTINQVEWHMGRSVCLPDKPDCALNGEEAQWLRPQFDVCPFWNTCAARSVNKDLLEVKEPNYKGTSY